MSGEGADDSAGGGRIADRLAIVDLTIAYCWALDTHDWDALGDVFVAEATAILGSADELVGIDAIRTRCSGALSPLDASQHMVSNHQVTFHRDSDGDGDGDTATCRCYFQAQHVRRAAMSSGGANFIIAGRYEDRLVRTPSGWRIAHRELVPMWRDGNVAVVRGD